MIFKKKCKEFIRLFLYKNGLSCIHIKEDVIINKYQCDFLNINKINIHKLKLPIELILHHRSMNCNSFITKELSKKEVINLVKNTIEKNSINNNQSNTIFYNTINNKESNSKLIQICECDLDKEMFNIFNLLTNNLSVSFTVFPIWVTTNFIKMYYNNTYEFSVNVFVIEYLDCWNIIVVSDHHIIYNRSGLLDSFQKHIELTNTLNHIKNTYNINIDDIIIYEFGEETIDSLTKYCRNSMHMITNINKDKNKIDIKKSNNIIKIACFSCIGINCYFLFNNFYAINNLIIKKVSNMDYINSCNKNIINDLNIWNKLRNIYCSLNNIDYTKTLNYYLTENHTDIINSLQMQLSNNNLLCSANV